MAAARAWAATALRDLVQPPPSTDALVAVARRSTAAAHAPAERASLFMLPPPPPPRPDAEIKAEREAEHEAAQAAAAAAGHVKHEHDGVQSSAKAVAKPAPPLPARFKTKTLWKASAAAAQGHQEGIRHPLAAIGAVGPETTKPKIAVGRKMQGSGHFATTAAHLLIAVWQDGS